MNQYCSPPTLINKNKPIQVALLNKAAMLASTQVSELSVSMQEKIKGYAQASKTIIRLPQLTQILSMSRSSVYLRLNPQSRYYDPHFPKPIHLGVKAVGWVLDDVNSYIDYLSNSHPAS